MRDLIVMHCIVIPFRFVMNRMTYLFMVDSLHVGFFRMVYSFIMELLVMVYCMSNSIMVFDLDVAFLRMIYGLHMELFRMHYSFDVS